MKKISMLICSFSALSACTSTLTPVGVRNNYSAFKKDSNPIAGCTVPPSLTLNQIISPDTSDLPTRLEWLNCEMLAKSMSNLDQAGWVRNRNEWRDIPLIGSALTAATLVLFGERGADGALLPGTIDVLQGLALGTAGFVVLADYLAPEEAAQLLFVSAQGHRCIAEHGQTIAAYSSLITLKRAEYEEVVKLRNNLAGRIEQEGTDAEKQAARSEIARADRAISFYLQQKTAKEFAPARSFITAYDFGIELTKRARRQPQSLSDIQSAIAQQIRLQQQNAGLAPTVVPEKPAVVVPGKAVTTPSLATSTRNLASLTNTLSEGLPNLALLVNGFTLCKTNALAGAPLPIAQVQYFGINEGV